MDVGRNNNPRSTQLMDNDEAGMDIGKVKVPNREDVYLEGRDLTKIDPENTETKINQSTDYTGKIVLKVQ